MKAQRGELVVWQDDGNFVQGRVIKVLPPGYAGRGDDGQEWYRVDLTMCGYGWNSAPRYYRKGETFYISASVVADVLCDGNG
jgi:hypothetical protein